jgi:VWFA-related protein
MQFEFGFFQLARAAAIDFVKSRMMPNDFVSVVSFDKRVDLETPFTNDRDAVLSALESMRLTHRKIEMDDHFFAYLEELAGRAAHMPHKVSLILVAAGMLGVGGAMDYGVYNRAIRSLQAADVRVYGIDTRGLSLKDPGAAVARFPIQVAAKIKQSFNLGLYSGPTGGRYFRYHNDILDLFERVDYEMSAWYVLGFYLDERDRGDQFDIDIDCTRPEVALRYKNRFQRMFKAEAQPEKAGPESQP